jgi:uncharacterized protein YcbK (DUF882 family)
MPPVQEESNGSPEVLLSRRRFIKLSAFAALARVAPAPAFAALKNSPVPERKLSFYNPHTDESLRAIYWVKGEYLLEALADINHLMRDYRADEIKQIDTGLLDLLYALRKKVGAKKPFYVVSGYRCPATNAYLRMHGGGAAKNSLHMYGMAADIRLPGYRLSNLKRAAVSLKGGGVGYYPKSDFIHVDVGPIRYW